MKKGFAFLLGVMTLSLASLSITQARAPDNSNFSPGKIVGETRDGFIYEPTKGNVIETRDGYINLDNFIERNAGSSTSNQALGDELDSYINETLGERPNRNSLNTATGVSGGSIAIPYKGPVFNGPGLEGGANVVEQFLDDSVSKERDIKELIIGWTNFLLSVTAVIAVVALVWAGIIYITSMGDDSRMETAKKIIIWCIVGILVILAAYAIVNTVMKAAF